MFFKGRNLRYTIINIVITAFGMLLIYKLFSLQIIHGEEYSNISQNRLFREADIRAPRGEIRDRNGVILATNRQAYNVEILKLNLESDKLNGMILDLIHIFEENGDRYIDNFPMTINPITLDRNIVGDMEEEKYKNFVKKFKIKDVNATDLEVFNGFRQYYDISGSYSIDEARKIIGVRYELTQQPISQFDSVLVAMDISKETIAILEERHLDFPGVSVVLEPAREYTNGQLAAHILGYIGKVGEKEQQKFNNSYSGKDIVGKDGIESSLEMLLKGTKGKKRVEMDLSGALKGEVSIISPQPGDNVYLTLDAELQRVAEYSLEETIRKIREGGYADKFADSNTGAVVAMDVNTGEILAMANVPSYDPSMFVSGISFTDWNNFMSDEQRPMFNRAIAGLYPPGSTFKMVTAMAALSEGSTTISEKVRDLGEYKRYEYSGRPPACWLWNSKHSTHGLVDISGALKVSCNYYFFEMGYRTGINNINKYAKMFGLGEKTGIEIPGEKSGILAGPEYRKSINAKWYDGDTLSASIGQSDYSFTPVQMANYISTLVNGGTKNKATIIKKITTWDDGDVSKEEIKSAISTSIGVDYNKGAEKNAFEESYMQAIFKGMESVTGDAGGTAYGTFVNYPIKVAGKTGTAQVSGRHKDGTKKSDNAWFVGFAPYDNPEIAVVVIIENGGHGSYTAPVAKDIFSQYFGINDKKEEAPKKDNKAVQEETQKTNDTKPSESSTVQTNDIENNSDDNIIDNATDDSNDSNGGNNSNTDDSDVTDDIDSNDSVVGDNVGTVDTIDTVGDIVGDDVVIDDFEDIENSTQGELE